MNEGTNSLLIIIVFLLLIIIGMMGFGVYEYIEFKKSIGLIK